MFSCKNKAQVLITCPVLLLHYNQAVSSSFPLQNALNLMFVFPALAALYQCLNECDIQEILFLCYQFARTWNQLSGMISIKPVIGEKVPKMTFFHFVNKKRYEEVGRKQSNALWITTGVQINFLNDRVLTDKFCLVLPLELTVLMTSRSGWNLFA